jgi:hypothetical protein
LRPGPPFSCFFSVSILASPFGAAIFSAGRGRSGAACEMESAEH